MTGKLPGTLYWTPRVLAIIFPLFLSLFALDVINEFSGLREMMTALIIHLTPSLFLFFLLAIAWRWERLGGVLYILISLIFLIFSRGKGWLISAPLFIIGTLFLLNWMSRSQAES